jgi:hypothetical protein
MDVVASVDIIYVNYHLYDELEVSIGTLFSSNVASNLEISVTILDNSFSEAEPSSIAGFLRYLDDLKSKSTFSVNYIPSDVNLGFGAACNKGARLSAAPYVAFVNCDTLFPSDTSQLFSSLLSRLQDQRAFIAAPRVFKESGELHASCFSFDPVSILLKPIRHVRRVAPRYTRIIPFSNSIKRRLDRITYEGMDKTIPVSVDWVSGCFLLCKRSFFELVSGFDPRYFLYFEDVDLCRKARQLGGQVIFDPTVSIIHRASHGSASRKGLMRSVIFNELARMHIHSWLLYCIKWRKDIVKKASLILSRPGYLPFLSGPDAEYTLDFSKFKPKK